MNADQDPTHCRYDGCSLGPGGGPAPLVQPVRGGNLREYCSDRHRIAAHRARHRRSAATTVSAGPAPPAATGSGPPSEVVAELLGLADSLQAVAAEVGRIVALGDADRVSRMVEEAKLAATEAEGRATVAGAERDRERAEAAAFREMAARAVEDLERARSRAEVAEAAAEASRAELTRADAERDAAREALAKAEEARRAAEAAARANTAKIDKLRAEAAELRMADDELVRVRAEAAAATTAAEVAREQARAAEALRLAAETNAESQRARAEEALAARAELARALVAPTGRRNGRKPAG